MSDSAIPPAAAIRALDAPSRSVRSVYPAAFASGFEGRDKKMLGALFGLTHFGVNLTRLAPGAKSALRHAHARQDEFIYVLEGHPTLYTNAGAQRLAPGMCAGFKAGSNDAHHLVNDSDQDVLYLEIGDRTPGDEVHYPDDDLHAREVDGHWVFTHKDGTPY
ncbi:cupin domain-containing protein [Thermomonas alba]|uniref:cupin domain-containing protein n=1 Tax=Thermomonas alba TaxID=2888525 RepID=UPI001F04C381|nr:cupin domain-containing protein [Thermomonas alba]